MRKKRLLNFLFQYIIGQLLWKKRCLTWLMVEELALAVPSDRLTQFFFVVARITL
ncbi:MAG: hypothetical protein ABIC68_08650 [Candidatus Omnitrophota bacterium]